MQLPLSLIDEICKMIPFNPTKPVTLDEFLSENTQIKKIIKNNPDIKNYLITLEDLRVTSACLNTCCWNSNIR